MNIYDLTVEERVDNGWRWLDENFPGWQERVNIFNLYLNEATRCICGQLFRGKGGYSGYEYAERHLFAEANSWISAVIPQDEPYRELQVRVYLGFWSDHDGEVDPVSWKDLQAEWERRLSAWHVEAVSV